MWDSVTGKSRGYGFVAFGKKEDAEKAIEEQSGKIVLGRSLRCNWATQKSTLERSPIDDYPTPDSINGHVDGMQMYPDMPYYYPPPNTTVYVEDQVRYMFQTFGPIVDIKLQVEKGYAFVKMATQESADSAIKSLNTVPMNGKPLKCSWGKVRAHEMSPVPLYSPPPFYGIPTYPPFPGQVPPAHFPANYYPPQWQQEQQPEMDTETENTEETTPTYSMGYYAPVYYT